jgi:hypothetical protein
MRYAIGVVDEEREGRQVGERRVSETGMIAPLFAC